MPTVKQLSRIFSKDDSLNRLQDQLASALNPILRQVKGDLDGPLESPTVTGIRSRPIANVTPTAGQALVYDGLQWSPGSAGMTFTVDPPLVLSGTPLVLSIPQADATTDGYLSAADWVTFNSKLSPIVSAADGGTGLSTSGTLGNVLTSDGAGGWTSSPVPTTPPGGPAGGVLGYAGSTYPNPNGLAPLVFGPENRIPIAQGPSGTGTVFRFDPYNDSSLPNAGSSSIIGAQSLAIGSAHFLYPGGTVVIEGGDGTPYYSGSPGGSAVMRGGRGTNGRPSGTSYVLGGPSNTDGAGDAFIQGGFCGLPIPGNQGHVRIYGGFASSSYGGNVYIRGGGGSVSKGTVYVGDSNTDDVRLASTTTELYAQGQQIDLVSTAPTSGQFLGYNGTKWIPASVTTVAALAKFGNVLVVDAVNGNNSTGSVNGLPFATPEGAISYINTHSLSGVTVWILPGTYALAAGITVPDNCSLRGMSTQTTKLTLAGSNPGGTVTLLTMGTNTRVEDLSLTLTSTNATTNLVGVNTPSNSSTTGKLRSCVITVDNSTLSSTSSTNVYGIYDNGTGTLGPSSFSFNFTRGVTVNVISNGGGNKRAVFVDSANDITFRDTNFYVAAPVNSSSAGSYVGVETTNASSAAQFRTCSISGPTTAGSYTGSDILQTAPTAGFVDYGILLGPGTDLINRTAGGKPFTAYITPVTLEYGLQGNLPNSPHYLWVGVQNAPDNTEVFYRVQQKSICYGMGVTLRTAPGTGNSITVTLRKSTSSTPGSSTATSIAITLSGTAIAGSHYTSSVDFVAGEYLSVEIDGTSSNAAQDLVVELDLF